jgi:lipopolysaccharide assembly protein A
MQLITIVAMLVAAGGVVFALQNDISVGVTFLFWRFDSSLAIVLLLTLALGGFIVALVSTPSTLRRQWAAARQGKRVTELEKICAAQQNTITELEKHIPVVGQESPDARPYVGLKQIFSGVSSSSDSEDQNPPPEKDGA